MKPYYVSNAGRVLMMVSAVSVCQLLGFLIERRYPEMVKWRALSMGVFPVFLVATVSAFWDARRQRRSRTTRIDRILAKVKALQKVTETETSADSSQSYLDAYKGLLEEDGTMIALEVELKDVGYADAESVKAVDALTN